MEMLMKITEMAVGGSPRVRISVTDRDSILVSVGGKSQSIPLSKINGIASKFRRSAKARTVSSSRIAEPDRLSTGQNGPRLELRFGDLTLNEQRVLLAFDADDPTRKYTIKELAELAFPDLAEEKAYYYIKNQLRRLMRARLLTKPNSGVYMLSVYGMDERLGARH